MRARCPASSANLGPGFDTLALALELHVEVEVDEAPHLIVRTEGEGAEIAADASHLAAQVALGVAGHDRLAITVRSSIPVARGLGSSAALVAATAAASGAKDPLGVAARADGHPENAAASVKGGLVTATTIGGSVSSVSLPLDPALRFVVLVPDRHFPTATARKALPSRVAFSDAAFNLGRLALLIAGLADRRLLRKEATEDRLHEAPRSVAFPESHQLLSGLVEAGAKASCWSGSGPSLLGICEDADAPRVRDAGEELLAKTGVGGRALLLACDMQGLVVGPLGKG